MRRQREVSFLHRVKECAVIGAPLGAGPKDDENAIQPRRSARYCALIYTGRRSRTREEAAQVRGRTPR